MASTSHDLPQSLPGDQYSLGGMSKIRSVHDSPDVNDNESSSGDKSESAGPEVCHATGSGGTTSSDDSGTTHQEATPERNVDVDMDKPKISITAQIIRQPQMFPFRFAPYVPKYRDADFRNVLLSMSLALI